MSDFKPETFFAGSVAGVCSTIVTNPFDTIRARQGASREASGVHSKGLIVHCRELFSEGIFGAWRVGLVMNLATSVPTNTIYLPAYNYAKQKLDKVNPHSRFNPIWGACFAVFTVNTLLAPFFTIRSRSQMNGSLSSISIIRNTFEREGVKGFYRGTLTNMGGRMVEEAIFWWIYEELKLLTNEGTFDNRHFLWASFTVFSLSSLSKFIGTAISYPYNVVMTHLRTVNKITGVPEHTHFMPTVKFIYVKDGLSGFYRGLVMTLFRSMMSKGSQLYAYEFTMALMLGKATCNAKKNNKV